MDVQALYYTLAEVDAETLVYEVTDGLPVVEEEKVCNMPAKVECKAVLDTLAARETEVKVHTPCDKLSEVKEWKRYTHLVTRQQRIRSSHASTHRLK